MLRALKAECLRVLEPHGHLVLYLREGGSRIRKVFDIFQKRRRAGRWRLVMLRSQVFRVPYIEVPGFWWWALPVAFYRKLIARYSRPGTVVMHVFSGSGNGGIAAAQLGRTAVLVDRHYHWLSRPRVQRELAAAGKNHNSHSVRTSR